MATSVVYQPLVSAPAKRNGRRDRIDLHRLRAGSGHIPGIVGGTPCHRRSTICRAKPKPARNRHSAQPGGDATPETASLAEAASVGRVEYQPFWPFGESGTETAGRPLSFLIVTLFVVRLPPGHRRWPEALIVFTIR